MFRSILLVGLLGMFAVSATAEERAGIVRWKVSDGGNGHFYQAVSSSEGVRWDDANSAARAAGGYLASITSEAENEFVFPLIDAPKFWTSAQGSEETAIGPWLGGYQDPPTTVPSDNWKWASGEPWSYEHWGTGLPDHYEHRVQDKSHFYSRRNGTRASTWNDLEGDNKGLGIPVAYVIEWDSNPAAKLATRPASDPSTPPAAGNAAADSSVGMSKLWLALAILVGLAVVGILVFAVARQRRKRP